MKSVLITGSSSGYGLETARFFHAQGWRVVAGMRSSRADVLPTSPRIHIAELDVTKPESIARAIASAGDIDVLVNNAGVGHMGALEAAPIAQMRRIFETNTFGVMAMCQAVIPQMRARRGGVIVNVTSSVVLAPHPLVSVYAASKWAIEGLSECLAPELNAFGVRVKIVQPGYGPTTRFIHNTDVRLEEAIPIAYQDFARPVLSAFSEVSSFTTPQDVADGVWRAAHDETTRLRFPAGADAAALASA